MTKFYPDINSTRLKVGIYGIFILIILIGSYMWLSGRLQLQQQQNLSLSFEDVMGLEIGDKIMYRGMEVGRVRSIRLNGDAIIVQGFISSDIKLLEGSRFYVSDSSLMGGKTLNIVQGTGSERLVMSQVHKGDASTGMMAMMQKASLAVEELNFILADLRSEGGILSQGSEILQKTDNAIANIDQLAISLKTELIGTLDKVDYLTGSITQVVVDNDDDLREVMGSAPRALANVNSTLDSLQHLSSRLHSTFDTINSGSGTAARLMNDPALYDRMLDSLEKLENLIADVKANPRKYIKFSLF